MARTCSICEKGPATGNHVSHAKNRRKRRWFPNLQTVKAKFADGNRRIRVCTNCIKSERVVKAG